MQEPKRIPLDPSTPTVKSVKPIPMPPLYPEVMRDDTYSKAADSFFWKFIAEHKESRENWKKQHEDNKESNQT
jgi:hypothetical protein